MENILFGMIMEGQKKKGSTKMDLILRGVISGIFMAFLSILLINVGMKMEMNVNVVNMVVAVNNPHPKHLSKSPAVAGFFVCEMMCIFGYG